MTRRETLPVLRKIASRRWRTERNDSRQPWVGIPAQPSHGPVHLARFPALLTERILTPREIEVLYHVARGETDQQIADRLYLSRRTVSSHVSNILGKLDAANRRDAVATAFRLGSFEVDRVRGQTSK